MTDDAMSEFDTDEYIRQGLLRYLTYERIKNVGEKTALALVDAFDDMHHAVDVIFHNPEYLRGMNIRNINTLRLNSLIKHMTEHASAEKQYRLMKFFSDHGFTDIEFCRIRRGYATLADARNSIKTNPYCLLKLDGFNNSRKHNGRDKWVRIDEIASTFHMEPMDHRRVLAAINYTIDLLCQNGSTSVIQRDVIFGKDKTAGAKDLLKMFIAGQEDELRDCMQSMIDTGELMVANGNVSNVDDRVLQSLDMYVAEQTIIKNAARMIRDSKPIAPYETISNAIDASQMFVQPDKRLNEAQREAVHSIFKHRLSVVTGAAGTGKTTALGMLVRLVKQSKIPFILCAPTGKAAKRMQQEARKKSSSEACAYTIHRAMRLGSPSNPGPIPEFARAELVICDEASMLDTYVAAELFKACGNSEHGKRLILVGDVNQLPSVGPGQVFKDLLDCPDIPTVCLTSVLRQSEQSKAGQIANAVLAQQSDGPIQIFEQDPTFRFFECDDAEVLNILDDYVMPAMKACGNPDGFTLFGSGLNISFISPTKQDRCIGGTPNLNKHLRDRLIGGFSEGGHRFRVGDFVMQTSNMYQDYTGEPLDTPRMNGDLGVIDEVYNNGYKIRFLESDGHDSYSKYSLLEAKDNLTFAYASTVHKYQGSECDAVVVVMTDKMPRKLLNRNLLYTAVSRAKGQLFLVGNRHAFERAARTPVEPRMTGLKDLRLM